MAGRWMIYSHDALGLGHVRRSLAITRAVLATRPDVAALLVTCSPLVDALPMPRGLDYIKLPSARKLGNQHYEPRSLSIGTEHLRTLRRALLRESARQFDPDLFLVDKSPAGLMGELLETLDLLRARHRPPRLVLGLRDILDQPAAVVEEWRTSHMIPLVERHYDEIWIYGDPAVFDACDAYGWPPSLASRVRYLGYLVPDIGEPERRAARHRFGVGDEPMALVTVGGGEDGEPVIATYLRAAERGLLPASLRSVVVLGPCMPLETQAALLADAPPEVHVVPFVPDLAPAVAAADVVVGMAGYNTVCELMAGRTPSVLVPRVQPRREQWLRARRLEERGVAECLEPDALEPVSLAEAVRRALARGRNGNGLPAGDGLEQVIRQVGRILPPAPGAHNGQVVAGANAPPHAPPAAEEP